MANRSETFVPLDEINQGVIDDFVQLLVELDEPFSKLNTDAQYEATELNLTAALETPSSTVLVHRDNDKITSTATGNIVAGEGWVDDVVTRKLARGRGLGRESMLELHDRFREVGIMVVRLTSNIDRGIAGKLYGSMGYVEGGKLWRARLSEDNANSDDSPDRFVPFDCKIPIGHKAWFYGPNDGEGNNSSLTQSLRAAGGVLLRDGVVSVNYFSLLDPQPGSELTDALEQFGFEPRTSRLYTYNIE